MTPYSTQDALACAAGPATGHAPTWIQVLSDLDPRYGGISAAIPDLAAALETQGVRTSIAGFVHPEEHYTPPRMGAVGVAHWPSGRGQWLSQSALRARFREAIRFADGLHIHGLWQQASVVASRAAAAQGKPYVLSAHGMLEPWALRQHRLRKQIYAALVERRTLRHAGCLHALTRAEADTYRTFAGAGTPPVVVIPNGVARPASLSPQPFLDRYPQLAGRRILLFLARLHAKKGADLLVQAFLQVAAAHPDAVLVLAGPDADGMRAQLELLGAAQPDAVLLPGMLDGRQKWSALAAAECFVLPSHSEGLSMGVLEAMAAGKPVLLTPQCNMPEVADHGAGWLVHPRVEEIAEALRFILGRTPGQNAATGDNGRVLVERDYTWASVASRMADVYRWLQGDNVPATCEVRS